MCGIFGIARPGGLSLEDRWLMRHMADAIRHRGPDGEGFCVAGDVAIGMRRLSIIDTDGGWQPIWNEDRTIAIVANGEIYNFVELRQELQSRGHQFRTGSDCETIVHLYEELGEECVHRLRGMFAFAIIDLRSKLLILVRDRMGEKPLMLAERNGSLVFCSELSGLIGSGAVPLEFNDTAINMYFHWGFVPEPLSAVTGTRKLPAGAIMTIDLRTGDRAERVYWRLEDSPPLGGDPVDRIREELSVIGRITMRSDVPIGIGLSSGIDSSAIAAMACAHATQPVSAFCVGYQGRTWQDESALAGQFAKFLGIPFHRVELSTDRVVMDFPEVCLRRDDPVVDLAGSNIYALMRLGREHGVPVMLSGLGGDELFGGYQWFRDAIRATERKGQYLRGESGVMDYLRVSPPPLSIVGGINWMQSGAGLLAGLNQWRRDRSVDPERLVFWDQLRGFQLAESMAASALGERVHMAQPSPASIFTGAQYWSDIGSAMTERICSTYLRCNGLNQTDRLSMANSVEGRVPFVDYRLAELVIGLQKGGQYRQTGHKAWLKAAFSETVPKSVLMRKKRGFSPPWRTWTAALMSAYGPDLEEGELVSSGILRADAISKLRRGFDWLRRPSALAMESLVLEQWARGMRGLSLATRLQHEAEPDLRNFHDK